MLKFIFYTNINDFILHNLENDINNNRYPILNIRSTKTEMQMLDSILKKVELMKETYIHNLMMEEEKERKIQDLYEPFRGISDIFTRRPIS